MNSDQLYINGNRIILTEESHIALTYQVNNIGELKSRQASLSNTFQAPAIAENAEALESSEQPSSETDMPYRKLPARLVRNGTDVRGFENAIAIIENTTDGRFYNITLYGGNLDFFSVIEGKSIRQLQLSDLDHVFNRGEVMNRRFAPGPIGYPIIDHSTIDNNTGYSLPTNSRVVDVRNMYFSIRVSELIQRIFDEAGFTVSGDILTDPYYTNMMIEAVDKAGGDVSLLLAAAKQLGQVSAHSYPSAQVWAKMNVDIYDPLNCFTQDPNGIWSYEAQYDGTYDFVIKENSYVLAAGGPTTVMNINLNSHAGVPITTLYSDTAPNAQLHIITLTGVVMTAGQRISAFAYGVAGTSTDVYVGFDVFEITCTNISTATVGLGSVYPIAPNLPDIKQADLIQCVMQQFFLFPITDSVDRTVRFVRFENVRENIPIARKWSAFMNAASIKLSYRLPGYAQENVLRYKPDTFVPGNPGDGTLTVADETLAKSRDQFVLPFAASLDVTCLNGLSIMRINRLQAGGSQVKCEPRIFQFYTENISASDPIIYTDGAGTSPEHLLIGFAYFKRSGKPYNLDFQGGLIPAYGQAWRDVIYQPKIIDALINFPDSELNEFEHDIPAEVIVANEFISVTGNFYVNVISNYIPGRGTAVQLIRL